MSAFDDLRDGLYRPDTRRVQGGLIGGPFQQSLKKPGDCQKCGLRITKESEPKLWFIDGDLKGAVCGKCAKPMHVPVEEFR